MDPSIAYGVVLVVALVMVAVMSVIQLETADGWKWFLGIVGLVFCTIVLVILIASNIGGV